MDTIRLKRDEEVAWKLRRLYERRGFRRAVVGRFEDYALYVENKNFLSTEHIITFMDMDGKLLALKPDTTLSIVKNIPEEPMGSFEKLYYLDEVYRISRENREYKVLNQIGVELIGPTDAFSGVEIADLALESLRVIGGRSVLDLSHLGFVSGLLEQTGLGLRVQKELLSYLHAKSVHEVDALLEREGASTLVRERIRAFCDLHGPLEEALPRARSLVEGEQMEEAFRELEALGKALSPVDGVNLDFSVVNDVDYYNGLIFQGYVEGVPGVVLTGGRYDNLMARMGKDNGAIGFAVYLSELERGAAPRERECDFDLLVTYGEAADHRALLEEVRRLAGEGKSVRLEREGCCLSNPGFTYGRHIRFGEGEEL